MKRALVLVLAVLGTAALSGCSTPPPPYVYYDVNVYWRFLGAQGQPYGDATNADPGCADAGVDQVRVTLQGPVQRQVVVTCVDLGGTPGIRVEGLLAGNYLVTTEGLRGGLPVYLESQRPVAIPVPAPGDLDVVPAAIYGDMNVFYDLPAGVTCANAAITEIAFELYEIGALVPWYSSAANAFVPCRSFPDNGFIVPSVPPGSYRFRYVSAMQGATAAYQVCGVTPVQGSGTQSVTYFLPVATFQCP